MPAAQAHQAGLLLLLAAHLAAAVYWDAKERRIPNGIVFSGLLTALVVHALVSGLSGLGAALVGAVTGLLVLLPLNILKVMGAGDVKLMAMVGAFGASIQDVLWMVLYTLLAGGLLAVLFAFRTQVRQKLTANLLALIRLVPRKPDVEGSNNKNGELQPAARLPYAVAITCGSLGYLIFDRL
jgi:prepilin peptidase CpaA